MADLRAFRNGCHSPPNRLATCKTGMTTLAITTLTDGRRADLRRREGVAQPHWRDCARGRAPSDRQPMGRNPWPRPSAVTPIRRKARPRGAAGVVPDPGPPPRASGGAAKSDGPEASKDDLLSYYREMLLIRRFEGEGGPALWHGPDRRLLSSLYRPGGCGRRHAGGAGAAGHGDHRVPATMATCWPAAWTRTA